ncbi:hypothetical protein U1707_10200 [Sphingomonas sp. PB2P12]
MVESAVTRLAANVPPPPNEILCSPSLRVPSSFAGALLDEPRIHPVMTEVIVMRT